MILKKIFAEGLAFVNYLNSKNMIKVSQSFTCKEKQQYLYQKASFLFSQKKQHSKKKSLPSNQAYKLQSEHLDFSALSKNQQYSTLKQSIHQLIDANQDDQYFMEVLQTFSNLIAANNRVKDGIVEFGNIVTKMKKASAFKSSPNYHFSLCEYRYFLVRGGRYDEAVKVCEQSLRLLKRGSQKESLHVANELGTFGVVQFMNNDQVESRWLLQKEDKLNQKLSDQTFTEYIDCKNNLAILDFVQGKHEEAEKVFQRNAQFSRRILKSTKKGKEKLYAKHLVYLQAINEIKISKSTSQQVKLKLKLKVNQFNRQVLQILTDNNNLVNDLYLYYETISKYFLKNNMNELCAKFIQKAIHLNEKKIEKAQTGIVRDRSVFQVIGTISKHYHILGQAHQNQKQFDRASECFQKAKNTLKKNILSTQAKQLLTLQSFTTFIQCCRSLFELQFIEENKNHKSIEEAIKYMQEPLLVWNEALKNIWNCPKWLIFVPYELNMQIGIKLVEKDYVENGLLYFQACSKEIMSNKNLLCQSSRKSIGLLNQNIKSLIQRKEIKDSEYYQSLKSVSDSITTLFNV